MKCFPALGWQRLALMAVAFWMLPILSARSETTDLRRERNADAEKKGLLIWKNYKLHQYTFENTNPDKLVHIAFKLGTLSFSGSTITTYITRTHTELDIPPQGKVTYDIPAEIQTCTVKFMGIGRLDPPKSALPPKKP